MSVHSHGWEIRSAVVIGGVVESSFRVDLTDDGPLELYRVVSSYGVGDSALTALESPVSILRVSQSIRSPGSGRMLVRAGEFHSTEPFDTDWSVTVAATEVGTSDPSLVVAERGLNRMVVNQRPKLEDFERIADAVDHRYEIESGQGDQWAAFIFVVSRDEHVLMVRTLRSPAWWSPVGGRQELGDEVPIVTAKRELREETGIDVGASRLDLIGSAERDVGRGRVYFWALRVSAEPPLRLQHEELAEARWIPFGELASLNILPATSKQLDSLRYSILQGNFD